MNNIKIGVKLIGGFVIVAIIAAVVGIIGIVNLKEANRRDKELYTEQTIPISNLGKIVASFHQIRVTFTVHVFDDPKDAEFRIHRPHDTLVINPDLREIIADKVLAHHRGGGFAAA